MGNDCGFCHSPNHKAQIEKLELEICSGCHMFVQETLSQTASAPINVHLTFKETLCSACHDPHSSPYPYMLKKDPGLDNGTKTMLPAREEQDRTDEPVKYNVLEEF